MTYPASKGQGLVSLRPPTHSVSTRDGQCHHRRITAGSRAPAPLEWHRGNTPPMHGRASSALGAFSCPCSSPPFASPAALRTPRIPPSSPTRAARGTQTEPLRLALAAARSERIHARFHGRLLHALPLALSGLLSPRLAARRSTAPPRAKLANRQTRSTPRAPPRRHDSPLDTSHRGPNELQLERCLLTRKPPLLLA